MSTPASAQSLLEALFGRQRPQQVVYYAPVPAYPAYGSAVPRAPRALTVKRAKPKVERAKAGESGKVRKADTPAMGSGPLGPFINDPTLRSGDVVVTTSGLMVFRGGGERDSHRKGDFVSLRNANISVAGFRRDLVSIDVANRRTSRDQPVFVANQPAFKPVVATDEGLAEARPLQINGAGFQANSAPSAKID